MLKKLFTFFTALTLGAGLWAIDNAAYIDAGGQEQNANKVIEITNPEGVVMYYILDSENKRAMVTWGGEDITSGTPSYVGDIIIPEYVRYKDTTYTVTVIADSAFYNCTGLTSVIMPNTIRDNDVFFGIGKGCFCNCTGLTSVTLSESLVYILPYTFKGCTSLKSIVIGPAIYSIAEEAFYGCTALASVTFDSKIRNFSLILKRAFYNCSQLTTITFPSKLYIIGAEAFCGSGLRTVYINNSTSPSIDEGNPFCSSNVTVYVPMGANYSSWKAAGINVVDDQLFGKGTKDNPYLIHNYDELLWFSQQIKDGDQGLCARLEANIDASGKKDWLPIGKQGKSFAGTFNGNGHIIRNLHVTSQDENVNIGLFGKIGYRTEVYGLGIVDGYFEGKNYVGAICGDFSSGSIHDCYVFHTKTVCHGKAGGGIVGSCFNVSELRDCYIRFKDYDKYLAGIICGNVQGKILNCYYISEQDLDSCAYQTKDTAAVIDITRVRVEDAQSGKLCNMLNHYGSNGNHWYQTLGSDESPVLDFSHGIVKREDARYINCSRDNLEITYFTSDNEPITLHGDFEFSGLKGNYFSINENGFKSGHIVCDQPITMIASGTFAQNPMLTAITLPNSLTMIGNNAFAGCDNLAEITLGDNMTSVGEEAFMGCSALQDAYIYAVQPPQCGSNAFAAGTTIHVIDAAPYKQAEGWKSLNIVGDTRMMAAYKVAKKNGLVKAAGANTENDMPAEIRDKYNEYAASINSATTVAAIEAICVPAAVELQKMAQLLNWKNKGEIKTNY